MSNKKELTQISSSEAAKMSVSALAVRPNDASRFGQGGLSAKDLQEWFDKLPNLVKDKFNEIARMLASPEAAKYIGVDALGVDNLHDFLLLFGARGTGPDDKNISDFIEVLYADIDESAEQSRPLREVLASIVSRLVEVEAYANNGSSLAEIVKNLQLATDESYSGARLSDGHKLVLESNGGDETEVDLSPLAYDEVAREDVELLKGRVTVLEEKIAEGANMEEIEALIDSKLNPIEAELILINEGGVE